MKILPYKNFVLETFKCGESGSRRETGEGGQLVLGHDGFCVILR